MSRLQKRLLLLLGNSVFFILLIFLPLYLFSFDQFEKFFMWFVVAVFVQAGLMFALSIMYFLRNDRYEGTSYLYSFLLLILLIFIGLLYILDNSMVRVTY